MIASIPRPSSNMLFGRIHMYGVMIALGVLAGVWLGRRRWGQRGHDPDDMADVERRANILIAQGHLRLHEPPEKADKETTTTTKNDDKE